MLSAVPHAQKVAACSSRDQEESPLLFDDDEPEREIQGGSPFRPVKQKLQFET